MRQLTVVTGRLGQLRAIDDVRGMSVVPLIATEIGEPIKRREVPIASLRTAGKTATFLGVRPHDGRPRIVKQCKR